jgi:hypothetical protein
LPAWAGSGAELWYELGEREDKIRPVACVYVTRSRLDLSPGIAMIGGVPLE